METKQQLYLFVYYLDGEVKFQETRLWEKDLTKENLEDLKELFELGYSVVVYKHKNLLSLEDFSYVAEGGIKNDIQNAEERKRAEGQESTDSIHKGGRVKRWFTSKKSGATT